MGVDIVAKLPGRKPS